MNAERAYLFRHALLRDAAYQLQLPHDRARLHLAALRAMECLCAEGGEATLDSLSAELATHARAVREQSDTPRDVNETGQSELLYLGIAAKHAAARHRYDDAAGFLDLMARHPQSWPALRFWAHREAARILVYAGAPQAGLERARLAKSAAAGTHVDDNARGLDRETEPASFRAQVEAALARQSAPGLVSRALALEYEASCLLRTDQPGKALEPIEEALRVWLRIPEPWGRGQVLNLKGIMHRRLGQLPMAESALGEAIADLRQSARRRLEGVALANLGSVYIDLEEYERADQTLRQALAIHTETDDRRSVALLLSNLAALQLIRKLPKMALEPAGQALQILEAGGDRAGTAIARLNYSRALHRTQMLGQAREQSLRAADELAELGRHELGCEALAIAADAARQEGSIREARLLAAQAREALRVHPVVLDARVEQLLCAIEQQA